MLNTPSNTLNNKNRLKQHLTAESFLFILLVLLYLIPVWAFQYFPSQDGPAHVYNASLILTFNNPELNVFSEYLYVNPKLDPTWFGHLLLAGLMILFPVLIADKILLSIYIILFATGARYALAAINPHSKYLSILFFPFIYHYLLHKGFYAFSMSLAVGLFVIGFWLKHYKDLHLKNLILLWILSILLYLNHVVSLGLVCIIIGCMLIGRVILDMAEQAGYPKNSVEKAGHMVFQRTWRTVVAFLPSVLLSTIFILSRDTINGPGENIATRLYNLIHMLPLVSFNAKEIWVTSSLMLFLTILSTYFILRKFEQREISYFDSLLLATGVCLIFYLIIPEPTLVSKNNMAAGGFMDMRVSYYIYFTLILWIGAQRHSYVLKRTIHLIAIVISISLMVSNVWAYNKINLLLKDYTLAADLIEPNTTWLPLDSCGSTWKMSYRNRINPFLHASNYMAAERNVLSFRNYEANTGYFPFIYQLKKNPYKYIGALECQNSPPVADILNYNDLTGGQVDYVSMWIGKKVQPNHENILSIYRQLEKDYDLIYVSTNGLLELYRRKNWDPKYNQ